jgi:hypothetical protein
MFDADNQAWDGDSGEFERRASEGRDAGLSFDLSTPHIPPLASELAKEGYKLFVALGGSLTKLKGMNKGAVPPGGGPRGLATFSPASRKRLLQLVASLDRDTRPPLFLTLTYPSEWPGVPATWKLDLEAFYKRVCRKYPMCNVAVLWRLEPQKRGAPHFHLLVFGVPYISYKWVGQVWAEITSGNAATCSRVERVRSWKGAMAYASKYLGKNLEGGEFATSEGEVIDSVGRHWGVMGKKHLPALWVAYVLLEDAFHRVRRAMVAQKRSKGRKHRLKGRHCGLWSFMRGEDALRLVGLFAADAEMLYETPKL